MDKSEQTEKSTDGKASEMPSAAKADVQTPPATEVTPPPAAEATPPPAAAPARPQDAEPARPIGDPEPQPAARKWGMEEWRVTFTGIQAFAGITIALLALYGVFLTSLPETLVRQLRADVADAREELIGLRAERNRLNAQLDGLNASLRDAAARRAEAEQRLNAVTSDLGKATAQLEAAQAQLREERSRIERLQAEMSAIQAASEEARAKLKSVEIEISRLGLERERYLKVARSRDFLMGRIQLDDTLRRYKAALDDARNYMDAPKWAAEEEALNERMKGKSPAERMAMVREDHERQARDASQEERDRHLSFELRAWNRDAAPEVKGLGLIARAQARLDETRSLRSITGRALMAETFATPRSLTQADFVVFRQMINTAVQRAPGLSDPLLVRHDVVAGRGPAAEQEIRRVAAALGNVERFLDEFHKQLQQ